MYPRNDLPYAANLLHMLFAVPTEPYAVDATKARALETLLTLYLDHEQVCGGGWVGGCLCVFILCLECVCVYVCGVCFECVVLSMCV